jgi:tyrosinase
MPHSLRKLSLAAFTIISNALGTPDKFLNCTSDQIRTRVDFNAMAPEDRKAYTDAVLCLMDQPSNLDPDLYPAAINKYMDYAVIHVNRTQHVHLDGFFLTWHRFFLWIYEFDLINTCGYTGSFPYWDFTSTADDPRAYPIFDGTEYSISGDGFYHNTGPITLSPNLTIPHGTGGGCLYDGPFANMTAPMKSIDPAYLSNGTLPVDAFAYTSTCLSRDLNAQVALQYTNQTSLLAAVHAPNATYLEFLLNGVIGSNTLGIHSGAHFSVGGQMDSIHVSAQDPIWYPLHTFIDKIYWSWQVNNPDVWDQMNGLTGTALNVPPSNAVTAESVMPDWGYLGQGDTILGDLLNTTSGPFCYVYDDVLS